MKNKITTKNGRILGLILCIALSLAALPGCGTDGVSDESINVYYLSRDGYSAVAVPYVLTETSTNGQVDELLLRLSLESESNDYKKTIPAGVEINGYEIAGSTITLFFDADYNNLPSSTEILVRSAIVRTMIQLENIDSVAFMVGGSALFDSAGSIVGVMNANSFLTGLGDNSEAIETTSVTLYFASLDGQTLLTERREIAYSESSTTSLPKLVVDQLVVGPTMAEATGIFSSNTRVISATVTDGICYVNFDEGFLNQVFTVSEPVAIYSIVNTLTELDGVSKVQFYVNGSSVGLYRGGIDLSYPLERSEDGLIPIDENTGSFG